MASGMTADSYCNSVSGTRSHVRHGSRRRERERGERPAASGSHAPRRIAAALALARRSAADERTSTTCVAAHRGGCCLPRLVSRMSAAADSAADRDLAIRAGNSA
jgi:hypothetical protein